MTTGQLLLTIITGLAVNECCDVSPWLARKLVRWSAHRRYAAAARAELRAEELAALIDDRPGRLLKLITALRFAVAAVIARKTAPRVSPPTQLWWPTTPNVPVHHEDEDGRGRTKVLAVRQAWYQLIDEIRDAAKEVGVGGHSWRCCVRELRRISGDDR